MSFTYQLWQVPLSTLTHAVAWPVTFNLCRRLSIFFLNFVRSLGNSFLTTVGWNGVVRACAFACGTGSLWVGMMGGGRGCSTDVHQFVVLLQTGMRQLLTNLLLTFCANLSDILVMTKSVCCNLITMPTGGTDESLVRLENLRRDTLS